MSNKIILTGDNDSPIEEAASSVEFPMIDERWEPPLERMLLDMEVVALANRDAGIYRRAGLKVDSAEDVELYIQRQLGTYGGQLSMSQAEYYRMRVAEHLFTLWITTVIQQQQQRAMETNQILAEMNRPRKSERRH